MIINRQNFNWCDVLKPLAYGASIDSEDMEYLNELAGSWPTCACGQLCTQLPRNLDMVPKDQILRKLGGQFAYEIQKCYWQKALATFNKIERRSAKLLKLKIVKVPHKPIEAKPFAVTLASPTRGSLATQQQ